MKHIKLNLNKYLYIIFYILVCFVLSELLYNIAAVHVDSEESSILASILINTICYIILIVSGVLLLNKGIKVQFNQLCRRDAMDIFGICGIGLVCGYGGNAIGVMITQALGGADVSANQEGLNQMLFSKYAWIFVIIVAIVGPIVEELVFRKSIHDILRSYKLPVWLILSISSILFGAIHVINAGDFVQIFPYVFMGVALGAVEIYSRNIYPSIFIHIFINSLSIVMNYYLEMLERYIEIPK